MRVKMQTLSVLDPMPVDRSMASQSCFAFESLSTPHESWCLVSCCVLMSCLVLVSLACESSRAYVLCPGPGVGPFFRVADEPLKTKKGTLFIPRLLPGLGVLMPCLRIESSWHAFVSCRAGPCAILAFFMRSGTILVFPDSRGKHSTSMA